LYNVLENEVIPCFYDRKKGNLPIYWLQKMKASMKMAMESFCSLRMVSDYEKRYYIPSAKRWDVLLAENAEKAKKKAAQSSRLRTLWENIEIKTPLRNTSGPYRVSDSFQVTSEVNLGEFRPDEVDVELYYGHLESLEKLSASRIESMTVIEEKGDGKYLYGCNLICDISGRFGFTVRVTPAGDARVKSMPRLITWA
jgi:starch phosphorylase